MTWDDIGAAAKAEVGIAVPKELITPRTILGWASRAQSLLQSHTRAVKRTAAIGLNPFSSDGAYPLPAQQKFHTIRFLDYRPTGASPIQTGGAAATGFRIPLLSWDTFYTLQHNGILNPQSSAYSHLTPSGQDSSIVAGVNGQKIYFNPTNGFTGTVLATFIPRLPEYSPSAQGDWARFGADPGVLMQDSGPEPEFDAAIPGIIAFVKAQMIRTLPNFERQYARQHALLLAEFEEAKDLVAKEDTDYTQYEHPPVDTGGVF